ncbi:MAG: alkaline phosphatase family protein [Bacteroidales bacterium]|nr:alkaline phosphatase family protein [Bacteroidales bacterium]
MQKTRNISYLVLLFFITLFNVSAQSGPKIPSGKPKLIVGIVIEQMRYEYLPRYWDKLSENGFKKLINGGSFCRNARYNYLFTQSAPGHSTISTGSYPSEHGIVSNDWYNRLLDKKISATSDVRMLPVGGSFETGQNSPVNLLPSTFSDELKLFNNSHSKIIGIGMDPDAAILSTGHMADAAYWYDDKTGSWMSSSFYLDSLPGWVNEFNNKSLSDIYLEQTWKPLFPIDEYIESQPDTSRYEKGIKNQRIFPYDLDILSRIDRNKRDYSVLRCTPFGDTYINDFAITAILKEDLGKDDITDMINISFSVLDFIGHAFGPNSVEMEDAFLVLDRDLAHLLDFLEDTFGKENILVYLTAAHGVSASPELLESKGLATDKFASLKAISLLRSYLNVTYGEGDWVLGYYGQQIFLNRNLIEDSRLSLEDFQTRVAGFIIQFSGIANTVTSSTLQTTQFTGGIYEKIQNSFNQARSGDVIINLKPGWIEENGSVAEHNSAWSYDVHVPLIWYGWKVLRKEIYRRVDIIEIAPTLSYMLNISFPNASTADPIQEVMR